MPAKKARRTRPPSSRPATHDATRLQWTVFLVVLVLNIFVMALCIHYLLVLEESDIQAELDVASPKQMDLSSLYDDDGEDEETTKKELAQANQAAASQSWPNKEEAAGQHPSTLSERGSLSSHAQTFLDMNLYSNDDEDSYVHKRAGASPRKPGLKTKREASSRLPDGGEQEGGIGKDKEQAPAPAWRDRPAAWHPFQEVNREEDLGTGHPYEGSAWSVRKRLSQHGQQHEGEQGDATSENRDEVATEERAMIMDGEAQTEERADLTGPAEEVDGNAAQHSEAHPPELEKPKGRPLASQSLAKKHLQPRRHAAPSQEACMPCSGRAHGKVPSTLIRKWPNISECEWHKKPRMYLVDIAKDLLINYPIEVAKDLCIDLGDFCAGITCDGPSCQVRSGSTLRPSPKETEHSFLKDCPFVSQSDCAPILEQQQELANGPSPAHSSEHDIASARSRDLYGTAIVVLGHKRTKSLAACLESLLSLRDVGIFDVFVSLDDPGAAASMQEVVKEAAAKHGVSIGIWVAERMRPNAGLHNEEQMKWFRTNTGKIAHHYWFVFERVFMEKKYTHGIFVEEDLVVSQDFLALFRSTSWLLDADSSLWCISSWNDNGFMHSFSDPCRLMRTTYFPGLGFLLIRSAWDQLRSMWPIAPTMGWDYWMRVAFREMDKACIIPEIPRSHHTSIAAGASVTKAKQYKFFESMALAQIPNSCSSSPHQPCRQFGDIGYLEKSAYEEWLRQSVADAESFTTAELKTAMTQEPQSPLQATGRRMPSFIYVPYVQEEWSSSVEVCGLAPKKTKGSIPPDVRAEHYGAVNGRHLLSRAQLLLLDRRKSHSVLPLRHQKHPSPGLTVVVAQRDVPCSALCADKQQLNDKNMKCDASELHYINTCKAMKEHFPCEQGCAHQVGKELPVYVVDPFAPTWKQCLITFVSKMSCAGQHQSTARLCACVPAMPSGAGKDEERPQAIPPSPREHLRPGPVSAAKPPALYH